MEGERAPEGLGLRRRLNAAGAAGGEQAQQQQDQQQEQQQQQDQETFQAGVKAARQRAADAAGAVLQDRGEEGEGKEGEHGHGYEHWKKCCAGGEGKGEGAKPGHRRITTEGDVDVAEDDTCCFDWGLLVEPVTLLCGHTFCRHCVGIMLDDAANKAPAHRATGSVKCPLCCRALPAILPQPNVRLRNELRQKYPALYQLRLDTVAAEFEAKQKMRAALEGADPTLRPRGGGHITPEELQAILAGHQRRAAAAAANAHNGNGGGGRNGGAGAGPDGAGFLRFWRQGDHGNGGAGAGAAGAAAMEEEELLAADPVYDAVELFQTELQHIWRSRRWLSWLLALAVLLVGFAPLRFAPLPDKAAHVEGILAVDSWSQWWALPKCLDADATAVASPVCHLMGLGHHHHAKHETDDDDHRPPSPSSSSAPSKHPTTTNPILTASLAAALRDRDGGAAGGDDAFPGSELLATVYMYPAWGWIERVSRGVEGMVMDAYRVLHSPTPGTILSAFPGLAMSTYALCHQGWSAPFRELVAFLAIEGEIRQLMGVWTVLTIPTRIPRDPRDIPPLPEMPAYAWTVLSLTLAQGAYLLACEMVATLLDIVALSPMLLALTKGQYWRNEASLIATLLVRFWLMLREDWGLFRRLLGRRTHLEATFLRLFILGAVFSAPLWAARPLYNSTDLVSTLASAGDEIVSELLDEVVKAAR